MCSLIFFVSFILEGILSLYLPFLINDLNIYYSSFVLISIIVLYPIFKNRKKENLFYMSIILIGILYDFVYTDTFLVHSFLFFLSGKVVSKYYSRFGYNDYNFLFLCIVVITIYNVIFYLLLVLFSNVSFQIYTLFYKLIHSYFFNLLYGYILYKCLSKYRRIRVIKHKVSS